MDAGLQQAAYNALGENRGAIMVMGASTGKILAMVSGPSYDPNTIAQDWEALNADSAYSPLLNRVTQGAYAPGSTFKIVTALEYMREHPDYQITAIIVKDRSLMKTSRSDVLTVRYMDWKTCAVLLQTPATLPLQTLV